MLRKKPASSSGAVFHHRKGKPRTFLAKKSDFCHTTPILVDDPFLALGMTVNFPPWERFFDFPFRSYSSFRKKIRLTCQKVFPPPTVGAPSASNSPSALSGPRLQKIKSRELKALQLLASYWSWGESILSREYAAGSRLFWKVSSFSVGRCEQLFSPQAIGLHQAPSRFSSWFETELKKIKQAHNKTWVNSDHWPDLWQSDEAA